MNKKGFTLIEVLIGLIILAIGLLALASLQITSTRGNVFSNNLMQASYLAQDRLESLKNMQFDDANLSPATHTDGAITIKFPGSDSGVVFNRSYRVLNNAAGYKEITCTITWNDGVDHNIAVSTIRSR